MYNMPTSQKALTVAGTGKIKSSTTCPLPTLEPGEVLVKVEYIAINPFDGKSLDLSPTHGAIMGCDLAGTVVNTCDVQRDDVVMGDRVCGCVFGNNPDRPHNGAFAEYVAVPAALVLKVPSDMKLEAASTLGVGVATVGLALYHNLGLPIRPSSCEDEPAYVLVYGASTATGTLALQMLKWSGFIPIATCSPHSFEIVQSYGAKAVFDYHSPMSASDIRQHTDGKLAYALDCITTSESMKSCYEAIGKSGGKYVGLNPFPLRSHTRRSVRPDWIFCMTMFDRPISWPRPYAREARPRDYEFAKKWFEIVQRLLDSGVLKTHPFEVREGGLNKAIRGVEEVQKGKVSGKKLVYAAA